jgi:hypothetical protein
MLRLRDLENADVRRAESAVARSQPTWSQAETGI